MDYPRLLRAAALLLAMPLTGVVAGAAPAGAVVQPCTVSYSVPGGTIRAEHDAGKNHSLLWLTAKVDDARIVTDIDITADLTHPDVSQLSLHLLSPQTNSSLVPTIQAFNTGMASGRVDGSYTFDEDAGAPPLAGANPAPTTYATATPEQVLEGHPATGAWSLWLSNYGSLSGDVRSMVLTLTYATCDTDGDGVEDTADNCPTAANADQANRDADGVGDACDLDIDGDALANTADGCPAVAAGTTSGCPTVGRTASLRFPRATRRLKVVVTSDAPACESRSKVTLFRSRPGRDTKLVVSTTNSMGRKTWKAPARRGRYYVKVAASYAAGQAECERARSSRTRVS